MIPLYILIIGVIVPFFVIQFYWTQKFYSKNRFVLLLVISVIIPCILFFAAEEKDKIQAINFGLILFYYTLLLLTIKTSYKKINTFFINKKLINTDFKNKDFTYVLWDGDLATGDWWDKNLATKPSWLDQCLTFALILLPLLLTLPITFLT